MTRQELKHKLPVLTALANGEDVEWRDRVSRQWIQFCKEPEATIANDVLSFELRLKPKPREWWMVVYSDDSVNTARSKEIAEAFVRNSCSQSKPVAVLVREVLPEGGAQ